MQKPVVLFDLVGTLADLRALDPLFRDAFGANLRQEWFSEALKIAFSLTAVGDWVEFATILETALKIVQQRRETSVSWLQRRRILQTMRRLPLFSDVVPALQQLKAEGASLGVLTNSGAKAGTELLARAGALDLFDTVLSSDRVKRLKPAPEPYHMAAKRCDRKPGKIWFVAAHAWDIRGAKRAGMRTCFIHRPGQVLDELTPDPDLLVGDLREIADELRG
jgi:2-haloacid dehalogenase